MTGQQVQNLENPRSKGTAEKTEQHKDRTKSQSWSEATAA